MPAGWNLTSGELSRFHIELEKYWAHFNFVFSIPTKINGTGFVV